MQDAGGRGSEADTGVLRNLRIAAISGRVSPNAAFERTVLFSQPPSHSWEREDEIFEVNM